MWDATCIDTYCQPTRSAPRFRPEQRSGTFTWCPARRCSLQMQILESGPSHPACAMGGAQPPFSTTEAAHPTLHLRLLLLRMGDIKVNPGPVCSGCTGTFRVGSHPIICTQCQRLFHRYCNGLTRDQQKSPQGYVCGACGSTNGSTIQPSQKTRSQPNNTFFCQTNITASNHPCSRLPQQIFMPYSIVRFCAPLMRIASAAENHLQAPAVTSQQPEQLPMKWNPENGASKLPLQTGLTSSLLQSIHTECSVNQRLSSYVTLERLQDGQVRRTGMNVADTTYHISCCERQRHLDCNVLSLFFFVPRAMITFCDSVCNHDYCIECLTHSYRYFFHFLVAQHLRLYFTLLTQ